MFKTFFIFLFALGCFFCSPQVLAQNLTYEILWKEDSIGFLTASRKPAKNFIKYTMNSSVAVKFIAKVEMTYHFENIFSNGVLVKGTSTHFMNEKKRSHTLISWDGKKYAVLVDGEKIPPPGKPIKISMTSLYYKEPVGLKEVFSERFGVFCSIMEVAPHKYELTLPNGKKNYYLYKEGICTLVEVNHSIATFYFKLKNHDGKLVLN